MHTNNIHKHRQPAQSLMNYNKITAYKNQKNECKLGQLLIRMGVD